MSEIRTAITLDYRAAEAVESRRVLNRALYGRRGWAWVGAILLPVTVYVTLAAYASATLALGDMTATVIVGVGIVLLIYIRLVAPLVHRRRLSSLSGVRAMEGREVSYHFGEDGYRILTEHFDGFQKWGGVDRIIDDGKCVLIVLGPQAHFLPARAFGSAEERRAFSAWAVGKLPPEAQARSRMRP